MKKIRTNYIGVGFFIGSVLGGVVQWITKDSTWFVIFMMFGLAIGAAFDSRVDKREENK